MKKHLQSFDVCVVCALPEEARAFLEVVQQQSNNVIEECVSPRYHYSYRFATLKNNKDEPLSLHISWLPRYGAQEMTLHLSRVLEEYQPLLFINFADDLLNDHIYNNPESIVIKRCSQDYESELSMTIAYLALFE